MSKTPDPAAANKLGGDSDAPERRGVASRDNDVVAADSPAARRFRVFDWSTRWFWIVVIWEDGRLNASHYRSAHGRWFHALRWEPVPDKRGASVPDDEWDVDAFVERFQREHGETLRRLAEDD